MGFIDLHSHILPGFDDGARDREECLAMAGAAVRGGISRMVATPHFDLEGSPPAPEAIAEEVRVVNGWLEDESLELELLAGAEVRMSASLVKPLDLPMPLADLTLGRGGRYLLLDLPMVEFPLPSEEVFFQLQLAGVTPVLAHPERNRFIHDHFDYLPSLVGRGVMLQVNAGSLTGHYGKRVERCGWKILDGGLAHLIASDAHTPSNRSLDLKATCELIEERLGGEAARCLLEENPRLVLEGEPLLSMPPTPSARGRGRWFGGR